MVLVALASSDDGLVALTSTAVVLMAKASRAAVRPAFAVRAVSHLAFAVHAAHLLVLASPIVGLLAESSCDIGGVSQRWQPGHSDEEILFVLQFDRLVFVSAARGREQGVPGLGLEIATVLPAPLEKRIDACVAVEVEWELLWALFSPLVRHAVVCSGGFHCKPDVGKVRVVAAKRKSGASLGYSAN